MKHLRSVAMFLVLLPLAGSPGFAQDDTVFRIGVEDVLTVIVRGEDELSRTVKVLPDGQITLPLVNEIRVAGLTPEEAREAIVGALKDYVRGPNVTVIVEEINNFRVYFLGEVMNQGTLQFYRPTRLLQAVAAAGGLTEFSKKDITIIREELGAERRIEVDYKKLWAGEPGQENLLLKPGDTLLFK